MGWLIYFAGIATGVLGYIGYDKLFNKAKNAVVTEIKKL